MSLRHRFVIGRLLMVLACVLAAGTIFRMSAHEPRRAAKPGENQTLRIPMTVNHVSDEFTVQGTIHLPFSVDLVNQSVKLATAKPMENDKQEAFSDLLNNGFLYLEPSKGSGQGENSPKLCRMWLRSHDGRWIDIGSQLGHPDAE